jgi:glycosyltransferase involved in cell wall biosynthesis
MVRHRVGVVIPALNESPTIARIVMAVKHYGIPVVVDDGSIDNTAELSLESGAVVVTHEKKQGYDSALNSGFKKAAQLGCKIVITIDADGQHDPSLIQRFIDIIDSGADIVVGVRNSRQRFAEHMFAWYTDLRYGIEDPLCGMKAYRINIYEELGHFDSYGSIGTELMLFAAKKGYKINQIGFNVHERSGQSRFGKMLVGNYKIIRAMIIGASFKA